MIKNEFCSLSLNLSPKPNQIYITKKWGIEMFLGSKCVFLCYGTALQPLRTKEV
jgi:hypothetical protein